jgi:hypothetical protein
VIETTVGGKGKFWLKLQRMLMARLILPLVIVPAMKNTNSRQLLGMPSVGLLF